MTVRWGQESSDSSSVVIEIRCGESNNSGL